MYLEPSRAPTISIFAKKVFCQIYKKISLPDSHFNKVTGLYHATLLKERIPTQAFCDEFCKITSKYFFTEHLQPTASVLRKNILQIK